MTKYTFTTKLCKTEFGQSDSTYNFNMDVPHFCPICQQPQEGSRNDSKLWAGDGSKRYGTILYTCNSCGKKYLANFDLDTSKKTSRFGGFYPVLEVSYENTTLQDISPRFISLFEQALRAEQSGDLDLAATGYRNALECLVKDFAVKELGQDPEEVRKLSLYKAIGNYLEPDLVNVADVVRIFGNDFTHWDSYTSEDDFDCLKDYMNIFIKLVERQVKINHPPVSRS